MHDMYHRGICYIPGYIGYNITCYIGISNPIYHVISQYDISWVYNMLYIHHVPVYTRLYNIGI